MYRPGHSTVPPKCDSDIPPHLRPDRPKIQAGLGEGAGSIGVLLGPGPLNGMSPESRPPGRSPSPITDMGDLEGTCQPRIQSVSTPESRAVHGDQRPLVRLGTPSLDPGACMGGPAGWDRCGGFDQASAARMRPV